MKLKFKPMMIFNVYEPSPPPRNVEERAQSLAFVKDGFTWWGFLFGPFWLLYNALWLEFAASLLIGAGVAYGLTLLGLQDQAVFISNLLVMLTIGFEGNELRRWWLERKGYALISPVTGTSYEECERRFFEAWLPTVHGNRDVPTPRPVAEVNPESWGNWSGPDTVGALPGDTI